MNRKLQRTAVLLALCASLLSGCATRSPPGRSAERPVKRRIEKNAVKAAGSAGEESAERRVRAVAHFAAGISAELNEDGDEALDHYLKSVAADPDHEMLAVELARRFLQSKQSGKAIDVLSRASSSPRASGTVFAWLGRAYADAGKTDQAIKADLVAIRKSPGSIMAYRNLFSVYQENQQSAEALKALDDAAGQESDDPQFWVDLAGLYSNYSQLHPDENQAVKPKVVAALDRAAGLKPQDLAVVQKLAEGYKLMNELSKAEGFYLELLDRFPALPGTRENLADIYLRTDKRDKAAEQLKEISRDNPRNGQAYYFLGNIASQEKRYADAVEYFEQALTLKPDFEAAYYRLAELKINMNKPKDALEVLDKARSRFKENFVAEFLTAAAHARAKEYGEAVKHFTAAEVNAKATEPDSLGYLFYFQFGSTLERHGDYDEAAKYFHKCLELSPNFSEALNYLGYMWADRGENLDEAKKLIEKAIELEPKNSAYLDSMGWVLFKLKQPREALDWMQKAIQLSGEPDPTLYDHLGDIYGGLKEFNKARDAWRKSVELEANDRIKKKLQSAPGGGVSAE
jgi:tetratricopeptide (TPR) repeat protein